MMARQYDTGKHNECYRPIPVHTPSSRRVPASKPYANVNSSSEASAPPPSAPRYDSEYDYKTTHYPSYPPNYPYDDNKYKYEGGNSGGGSGGNTNSGGGGSQTAYNMYEKPSYTAYEEPAAASYDARSYMAPHTAAATPNSAPYPPSDADYPRYAGYDTRAAAYPVAENPEQYSDKGRYNYGYEQRGYYETDGRYTGAADCRYTMEVRYPDARHSDNRHIPIDARTEADCRYVDSRDMDRRYVDVREADGGRYAVMESREIDNRGYAVGPDGREVVDGRFADPTRYPVKENYYDRYYKHRPSRDHHVHADASRY